MKKKFCFLLFLLLFIVFEYGCEKKKQPIFLKEKIVVVTTLFPIYDFAKKVGMEKADVTILLPPGVDAHSFEPKPADILKINKADIFIYTGEDMEPWAEKILKSVDNKKLTVVNASKGIKEYITTQNSRHQHAHDKKDPHIWLDFDNAKIMVDNISEGFITADHKNIEFYKKNSESFKNVLSDLDEIYKRALQNCKTRYVFHTGHFAFGYLAKKYNLKVISAYPGTSPNEEPKPVRIASMINEIKKYKINYIFYEEFIFPRIAEVIKRETDIQLLQLNPAHNITKEKLEKGVSFEDIMIENLNSLKVGLQCQ